MKLHSKKSICLFILIGLCISPLYAYAKPQNRHFRGDKTWQERQERQENQENWNGEIHKQLNLTPEQAKKLQTLRNTHREKARQFYDTINGKKEDLKKELQKQVLDMERINQLHSEVKTMLAQREDDRLKHILEVREILTPEQLEKFLELRGNFHRRSKSKRVKIKR